MWNTRRPMERIVEQLEEAKKACEQSVVNDNQFYKGAVAGFNDAIEIVKEGGAE